MFGSNPGADLQRTRHRHRIPGVDTQVDQCSRQSCLLPHLPKSELASGQRLRVEDLEADTRYAKVPSVISLRLRSVLCTPLLLGGKVLGALYLGRRRLRSAFSERHPRCGREVRTSC